MADGRRVRESRADHIYLIRFSENIYDHPDKGWLQAVLALSKLNN